MLLFSLLACRGEPNVLIEHNPPPTGDDTASDDTAAQGSDPVAIIATPGPAIDGVPLSLDGSGSYDPDGDALTTYAWACEDGQTAAGSTVSLSFAAGTQTCTLAVTDTTGLSGVASVTFDVDATTGHAKWTVMVFMNGDNDLEEWALGDMNELEALGASTEVNFIVQIDRSTDYSRLDGNWTGARRYRAEPDGDDRVVSSPVLEDLGDVDSGDPAVIAAFAQWGIQMFPADHYALILWDHGWGWSVAPEGSGTKGISWDEGSGSDISPAQGELLEILDVVTAEIGAPLDLLGMDACNMANWEIAQQVRNDVGVYVASQDYENFDGYDYEGFSDLVEDPDLDPAGVASSIALHFHEIPDSTMSAIDLSKMDPLAAALTAVADALLLAADPAAMLDLAASEAQGFDGPASTDHDLADMMDLLAAMDPAAEGADPATADIVAAAIVARAALDDVVIVNYNLGGPVKNANGLSLYSPVQGRLDRTWFEASWASETTWGDFLSAASGS